MNLKLFALRGLASLAVMAGSNGVYTWYRARPVRHRDYWCVPNREPIPRLYHEASVISEAIAREDATWTAEMKELRTLIEQQKPGDFNLSNEFETTTKLRAYLEGLLARGEKAKQILVELQQGPSQRLNDLLKQAPAKYLEFAAEARRYAAETQRTQLKRDYLAMADVWSAKARAAASHQHDVEQTLNDDDLLEFIRERNLLVERILTMLSHGLDLEDLRNAAGFTKILEDVVGGNDFLSDTLRAWAQRLNEEPTPPPAAAPEPQKTDAAPLPPPPPEPQKNEKPSASQTVACEAKSERVAEPAAAPLPRVMQVATLKLFGGLLDELRERTRWLSTSYGGAHLEVPETDQAVGLKLCATRAEFLGQPPPPEPERPANSEPAVPKPPKPEPLRVQPAERQAPAAPQPELPRTARDAGWGDYSEQAKEAQEHYNYFREHGCFPPVTSAVPQPWVATGAASVGGPYPARWSPAAEIGRDQYLAARGDSGAVYRLRSRALRGY